MPFEHALDRRLTYRTVALAAETKAVESRQPRAALDSSPLWGAGRVEDMYSLLGHALRKALGVIAREEGRDQDVETFPNNVVQLRRGVAKERRISVEDGEMRHGRKSRSHRFDGYKRHIVRDLDSGLVRVVGLTAANAPVTSVTDDLLADLTHQDVQLGEIHLDRGYLASSLVQDRPEDLLIYCKARPVRNGDRYAKTAFTLDWDTGTIRCPNQVRIPFRPGGTVHFPERECQVCPLRERCTTSAAGLSVHIHPDERLLQELRARQLTPQGRAKLRERIPVEHALSHVGRWQGCRARYRGIRKNFFDLRRCAIIHNLHAMQHLPSTQAV